MAVVETAPLPREVRQTLDAMVAQADEIRPGLTQGVENGLERHLGIVGKVGVTVEDAPVLVPVGQGRDWLSIGAEGGHGGGLGRESDPTVVERRCQPSEDSDRQHERSRERQQQEAAEPAASVPTSGSGTVGRHGCRPSPERAAASMQ